VFAYEYVKLVGGHVGKKRAVRKSLGSLTKEHPQQGLVILDKKQINDFDHEMMRLFGPKK
jgi:hypothetical protein